MIKRVLTVLVALALLVAPITANPGMVSAVSSVTASASPSAVNTATELTVSFALSLPVAQYGSVTLSMPSFQVPNQTLFAPSGFSVTPSVSGLVAYFSAGGTITLYASATTIPATTYTVTFPISANVKTPLAVGTTYTVTVSTTTSGEPVGTSNFVVIGGNSVYGAYVAQPTPSTAGAAAYYSVNFYTSSTGQLTSVDFVYITFPTTSYIPTSVGAVSVLGTPTTAVRVLSSTQIKVAVPGPIGASSPVTVTIQQTSGILNPTSTGTHSLTLSTSADAASVLSNTFSISGSSVTSLTVAVDPRTPSSAARFDIFFLPSSPSAYIKYPDTIRVEFPAGTQFPSGLFCAACFTINGAQAQTPTRSGNTVTVPVPATITVGLPYVNLVISNTAGIINPSTAGSYSLKVSTSLDTTQVTSSQYTLVGTSISSLAVTATPTSQSAYPELRFTFTTSSSGALTTSDYIYIQIPSSMNPPSSIAASAITVNGTQVASSSSITSDRLSIRMPVSVGNSQQVVVVIAATAGLRNPSTVGTSVSFDVSTSQDVGTRSISYTTTISQIAAPQVSLTTNGVGKPSGYTVVFNTGAGGLLSANVGVIYIVFPAGTVVPASILGQNVRVNGSIASLVSSNSTTRRVEVRTPVAVQASTQVTVVIDLAANIVNPSTAGTSYVLTAYTSAETTLVNSAAYAIVNLPVSTAVTYPVNPDGLNSYYRTRPSVTITATSPSGYPVSIYYRINAGSDTLYAGPVQIPDGNVTLTYYARDSQSNQEAPRQLTFKVDATAPVVTILTPQGGSVTGTAIAAITGRTEAGATVTINGSAVAVQPSGDFGGSVTLTEGANSIQVVATDLAGNVGQTTVAVTLDTKPPVLTVTSPKIYATVMTHQVTVTGRTEVGATLHIAGTTTEVAADGTFSFVYMFPKDGLNVIDITATDASGNTARASIPVTYVARTLIRLQVGNKTAMINDAVKALQAAPVNIKGTVMVPIRLISEAFGATVEWEPVFKLVRLQLGDKVIYLQIGSKSASVNGKSNTLLAAPIIVSGTTMVPIRFISEAFDALVVWIEATKGIEITYPKP
jgi:hypothetical protein